MRVINTQEVHTVLLPGRANEVECLENTPILYKVEVKGLNAPCKFSLVLKQQEKKTVDYKIFCSQIHKEPTETQNEKVV